MNGFAIMADSYKSLVKRGEMTEEQAKRSIEIYEFLATCNQDDFCQMVDSSAFNDIIRAFLKKSDDVQSFLAREHSETRQSINSAKENIASFYGEFNTEKELKKLQYEYLKNNDKDIIDSINKIYPKLQ